jgi:DNA-3-methyladenine glycosylase I
MPSVEKVRCTWCGTEPLYVDYHDLEWGVPVHDDRKLFEMLILEGAQAGLSWITILKKRQNYKAAFDDFDPVVISEYGDTKISKLLQDPGIVRNRLKIASAVQNARAFLQVQEQFGAFDSYIWRFVNHTPIKNAWSSLREIPAKTAKAENMSMELRKLGFKFVGPTICYAFMQSVGLVNDHVVDCFRYDEV